MKNLIKVFFALLVVFGFLSVEADAQNSKVKKPVKNFSQDKGTFYFFWGWNRGFFSNSDIHFRGPDYDFVLKEVKAKDRQSRFAFDPYFKITRFTYPQTNVQFGYYFKDNWRVSFGVDHMKYVVEKDQTVKVNGEIQNTNTDYNGVYQDDEVVLSQDFLKFEHTDGLNYYHFELKRTLDLLKLFNCTNSVISVEAIAGAGLGFYIPKTNVTLLGNERNDSFNLAGYGFNTIVGLNLTFFNHFFLETDGKAGFVHLPNVRTTPDKADKAKHHFSYLQSNFLVGWKFRFKN